MTAKGYFSVLRLVPDPFRGEGINLGVLLLVPAEGYLDWRITKRHRRVNAFFKGEAKVDLDRLRRVENGLTKWLERDRRQLVNPGALEAFIKRQQDMLLLTDLRTCAVTDPAAELEALFERLVEPARQESATERSMTAHRVRRQVERRLQEEALLEYVQQDVVVQARWKPGNYTFSFGYQNGIYRIIHATSFMRRDPEESRQSALVTLGEIEDVRTHCGEEYDFSVVAALPEEDENYRTAITAAFEDKKIRLAEHNRLEPIIQQVKQDLATR